MEPNSFDPVFLKPAHSKVKPLSHAPGVSKTKGKRSNETNHTRKKIAGETQFRSAGYLKTTAILTLLLVTSLSGKAQTIYVLNGINVGGNYGNHESTIGEYTLAGVPVNTALVTVPGADMESIALAESLTMTGLSGQPVPGPKLFVTDQNNNVVSVYDAVTGALVNGSLVHSMRCRGPWPPSDPSCTS